MSFDETKYPEGKVLAFVCPQCGAQFKIKLGRKVVKTATGEEKRGEGTGFLLWLYYHYREWFCFLSKIYH